MLNVKLNEMGGISSLIKRLCTVAFLIFSQSVLACHWYDVPCKAREAEEGAKDLARGVERGVIVIDSLSDLVRGENRNNVRDVHIATPVVEGASDWMGALSDEILLSKLTIPGTHDSGTGALHLLGTPTVLPWTKLCAPPILGETFCLDEDKIKAIAGTNVPGTFVETQYWTVGEQLSNGIRFLDIRVEGSGPYTLYHGVAPLGDFHLEVMIPVRDFLRQHPREVVFMSIKEENKGKLNKDKFVSDVIFSSDFVTFVTEGAAGSTSGSLAETKLKNVRGKVVLFNRMDNADSLVEGVAVGGVVWDKLNINVQDNFENYWGCHFENTSSYPWTKGGCDSGRADKTKALLDFIDTLDTSGAKFNINFASAQMNIKDKSTAMDIVGNAGTQNGALLAYFKAKGFREDTGQIIVMDYPAYVIGQTEPNELLKLIVTRANQGKR